MKRRVLLCVLDWGLGHAARSQALLRELEANNCEVIIASSGQALRHLRLGLPQHVFYELPDYGITYDNIYTFEWGIALQLRKILKAMSMEKRATREIIRAEKIDIVISDNRYGCFGDSTRNVFLSHHLKIRFSGVWKVLGPLVNLLHTILIRRFKSVWIPDYPDRRLSGELSHSHLSNLTFVGPLTTLRRASTTPPIQREFLAVLSGPEPARTRFSDKLFAQLKDYGMRFLLVEGKPGEMLHGTDGRVEHMKREDIRAMIQSSSILIARSGYSTIMDMATMGGKAIFVPTPGQTEQQYLAKRMEGMGLALYQEEADFDLVQAASGSARYKGFDGLLGLNNDLLKNAILNLLADGKVD